MIISGTLVAKELSRLALTTSVLHDVAKSGKVDIQYVENLAASAQALADKCVQLRALQDVFPSKLDYSDPSPPLPF